MKKWIAALLCLGLVFTLLGCENQPEATESTTTQEVTETQYVETRSVGVCLPNQTEEYWVTQGQQMTAELERLGYTVLLEDGKDDVLLQAEKIRELAHQGVSCILLVAVDSYDLAECLDQIGEEKIPVIAYDRPLYYTDDIAGYVGLDYETLGVDTAQKIVEAKALETAKEEGRKYTIEFLMGSYRNPSSVQYYQGLMQVLGPYLEQGVLVCPSERTSFEDVCVEKVEITLAQNLWADLFSDHYKKTWPEILVTGDDILADGCEKLLTERGCPAENWPLITGQNATQESVTRLAAQKQLVTSYCDQQMLMQAGVDAVHSVLSGGQVGYQQSHNGLTNIPADLFMPEIVTVDNYETVLIETGIFSPIKLEEE